MIQQDHIRNFSIIARVLAHSALSSSGKPDDSAASWLVLSNANPLHWALRL